MKGNYIFLELPEKDAKLLISNKFDETCILSNSRIENDDKKIHKKFIYDHFKKYCSKMHVYDIDEFFINYNSGSYVNKPFPNAKTIIEALGIYKNKNAFKGTKYNPNNADETRSAENKRKVGQHNLKSRVVQLKL